MQIPISHGPRSSLSSRACISLAYILHVSSFLSPPSTPHHATCSFTSIICNQSVQWRAPPTGWFGLADGAVARGTRIFPRADGRIGPPPYPSPTPPHFPSRLQCCNICNIQQASKKAEMQISYLQILHGPIQFKNFYVFSSKKEDRLHAE